MPREGSNAWYRAFADRFYLDRANRDTYLERNAALDIGISGNLVLPALKTVDGVDVSVHAADLTAHLDTLGRLLRTGEYHRISGWGGYTSTEALAANQLYAVPLIVPRNITIDRIGVGVQTGVAGAARLGIYYDGTNLYPGTLLKDAGTIDTTTSGLKAITLDPVISLSKGLYWLAIVGNAAPTLRAILDCKGPLGIDITYAVRCQSMWNVAFTYAALPSTFTAGGGIYLSGGDVVSEGFLIMVRVASLA